MARYGLQDPVYGPIWPPGPGIWPPGPVYGLLVYYQDPYMASWSTTRTLYIGYLRYLQDPVYRVPQVPLGTSRTRFMTRFMTS